MSGAPDFPLLPSANFTRFYILARSINWQLPSLPSPRDPWPYPNPRNKGLLRIREQKSRAPSPDLAHFSLSACNQKLRISLADLLSALDLQICRIDRRPLPGAKTFTHVYIVEVDDSVQPSDSASSLSIISDSAAAVGDLERCGGDGTDLQSNKTFVTAEVEGNGAWALRLREAADRVANAGGHAEVLGCWS